MPNISEGRDRARIERIVEAASGVEGVRVLNIDPGRDTNRTVITFVGGPEEVLEAAYRLIERAAQLIDMTTHCGAHPRIGATDVVPFIPVRNVTMEECVELARKLGARVGTELGIPVYLYEHAATRAERRNLADVRAGEYEGLPEKVKLADWKPDFGPSQFNARSGATVIGARPFLIAYNVNLNTRDKKLATAIAQVIREQGYKKKVEGGKAGEKKKSYEVIPGRLKQCKAVGWTIEEYGCAQVSINLTDYTVTGLHDVFEACVQEGEKLGLRITGSELVGLVPKDSLLQAGRYFVRKQKGYLGLSEERLIDVAVRSLGLAEFGSFKPAERVIEYRISEPAPLAELTVKHFVNEVGGDSVAPGGGSVAALAGALAAALGNMVSALTFQKKDLSAHRDTVLRLGEKLQVLQDSCRRYLDEDTLAFKQVITAIRAMPKDDDSSSKYKQAKAELDRAYQYATSIPLAVARASFETLGVLSELVKVGLGTALSDLAVGAEMAKASLAGAVYNVRINLPSVEDKKFVQKVEQEAGTLTAKGEELLRQVTEAVRRRMEEVK